MWWWNWVIPALVASFYLWDGLSRRSRRLKLWKQSVLALSRVSEVETGWRTKLTAQVESLAVRLTGVRGDKNSVAVAIDGLEGASDLHLRRQILKLWTREIEVGDPAFDEAFLVDGPVRPVSARLDVTLRRLLLRAHADCNPLEIRDGRLLVEVDEEKLARVLPLLLDIGRRLAEPMDVDAEQQIARNARLDPEAGVRLFNLLLLVRERPGDPDTLAALRGACSDKSPEVRLRAAIELGEEGHDVLLRLAEKLPDDPCSAQAVAHLDGKLSFERTERILFRALSKDFSQTARACLEVLGQRRAAAVGTLARVMTEQKGELATAAALALGATGEAAAEAPLLVALQSEDGDLREAAAAALGHVGSVAAVPPLKEAAERSLLSLGLRRAARQAIAEIQSRLEGAAPGQLSLADFEAGQLSLADAEAGQLSLAENEAGQLALADPVALLPHPQEEPDRPAKRTPGRATVRH